MKDQDLKSMLEMDFGVEYISNSGVVDLYAGVDQLLLKLLLHEEISQGYTYKQILVHRHQVAALLCQVAATGQEASVKIANSSMLVAHPGENDPTLTVDSNNVSLPLLAEESPVRDQLLADMKALQQIRENDAKKPEFRAEILEKVFGDASNVTDTLSSQISDQDLEIVAFEHYALNKTKKWGKARGYYHVLKTLKHEVSKPFLEELSFITGTLKLAPEDRCDVCDATCFCGLLEGPSQKYFSQVKKDEDGYYPRDVVSSEYMKVLGNVTPQQRAVHQYLCLSMSNSPVLNMIFWDPEFDLDDYLFRMTYIESPGSKIDTLVREVSAIAHYYVQGHKDQIYN